MQSQVVFYVDMQGQGKQTVTKLAENGENRERCSESEHRFCVC